MVSFEFGSGSRLDSDSEKPESGLAKPGSGFSKACIRLKQSLDPDSAKPGSGFSNAWIRIQQSLDPDPVKPGSAKPGSRFSKAWIQIQQSLDPDSAKPESGSYEPGFKTLFKREGGPSISRIITFDSGRREERIVDSEQEGEQGLPGLSFHHLARSLDEKKFLPKNHSWYFKTSRDIPSIRVTSSVINNFVRAKRNLLGLFV
jgi:hypothetical protein